MELAGIVTYTGPDGYTATVTQNADGTVTLVAPSHRSHGMIRSNREICGSLEVAEAEIKTYCPTAAPVSADG